MLICINPNIRKRRQSGTEKSTHPTDEGGLAVQKPSVPASTTHHCGGRGPAGRTLQMRKRSAVMQPTRYPPSGQSGRPIRTPQKLWLHVRTHEQLWSRGSQASACTSARGWRKKPGGEPDRHKLSERRPEKQQHTSESVEWENKSDEQEQERWRHTWQDGRKWGMMGKVLSILNSHRQFRE